MNSLKKKVVSTSIIVIFALLSVIGSTFAWFTIDTSASVGDVELSIGTDVSLLIMMDFKDGGGGYDYSNLADKAILDNPANTKYVNNLTSGIIRPLYDYENIKLEPVTTEDGVNFLRSRQHNSDPASFSATEGSSGQFIQFSVWLLSQASNSTIAIRNLESTATNAIGFKNQVRDAVRLSIQNYLPVEGANKGIYIFGKNKDYAFSYRQDQIGYDSVTPANNFIPALQQSFLSSKHAAYFTTLSGETTNIAGERSIVLDSVNTDTIVTLTANVPQKLTIRVWIEGWDENANNNIMSALFTIKFDFVIKASS